jgi:hypothetical protein
MHMSSTRTRFAVPLALAVAMATSEGTAQTQSPDSRIEAALAAAAEAKIPASLLESKIREGEAKGAPRERIAAAVENRLAALQQAATVLRDADAGAAGAAELSVGADAMQAGVSAAALVRLFTTAPGDRRVVAVAVLADLVRLGVESEPAVTRVHTALTSGPEALANLRAEVASSLRLRGLLPLDLQR